MEVVSGVARLARCSHLSGCPYMTATRHVVEEDPGEVAPEVVLEVEPVAEDGHLDAVRRPGAWRVASPRR
jgi:hypothetical protein